MKPKLKTIIFLILIIIECITIFCFSHQEGDDSSNESGRIVEIISNIIPFIRNMQEPDKTIFKEEVLSLIVRKTAHFSIYTILGMFTMNFALSIDDKKITKNVIMALSFCCIYAMTDEIHQLFIQGRSGKITDVLIDSIGAFTGILFVIGIIKIYRKLKHIQGENT